MDKAQSKILDEILVRLQISKKEKKEEHKWGAWEENFIGISDILDLCGNNNIVAKGYLDIISKHTFLGEPIVENGRFQNDKGLAYTAIAWNEMTDGFLDQGGFYGEFIKERRRNRDVWKIIGAISSIGLLIVGIYTVLQIQKIDELNEEIQNLNDTKSLVDSQLLQKTKQFDSLNAVFIMERSDSVIQIVTKVPLDSVN